MATATITLEVDADAAKAFESAPELEQKKIQLLLSLWLKDLTSPASSSLSELMDSISERAEARGLTPEILELLLSDEE